VPVGQIATLIGRSFGGVVSRAVRLELRHARKPAEWSDEEAVRALELANEGHRYLQIIETLVQDGFPRRSKIGFGLRIRALGYGRGWGRNWTPDEDELLRRAYRDGASLTPLRDRLGRTRHSIKWRAEYLELQGTHRLTAGWRTEPPWSEAEIEQLRREYGKIDTHELAVRLGRSKMAVTTRANTLGLEHGYWRYYTDEEKRAFRVAFDHGISIADLAIALDRHAMTLSKYATDKLGMHFGRRRRRKPPLTLAEILALDPSAELPHFRSRAERRASR
jgi:transposase-like protein